MVFKFNFLFCLVPPTDVILEVKVDEDSQMYATCTVYGSNPVCNVQFKTTSGIIGSEKSSENISLLPYGAWNSVYGVNLNVSEEDNGTDVTCIVECDEFPVDLTDTVKILLPCKFLDISLILLIQITINFRYIPDISLNTVALRT
jgi:hypothetical protein